MTSESATAPQPSPHATPLDSATDSGLLAAVLPLEHESVVIVYSLRAAGGLSGHLELMVQRGGYRRENWTLELAPGTSPARTVTATTIQTPAWAWTGIDQEAGTFVPLPLAALERDFRALSVAEQARIHATLARWHERVLQAREQHPVQTERVLDHACAPMALAAQTLCIWERVGLPLRYSGGAFELEAIAVHIDRPLAPNAFTLPPQAKQARHQPSPDFADLDVDRLLHGYMGGFALLAQPGWRVPAFGTDGLLGAELRSAAERPSG